MEQHELIHRQFGANAANYATSPVHAKGASLGLLVDALPLAPTHRALDIATAAGHTAFAIAPHVSHVTATDLVTEMLEVARSEAETRRIENVSFEEADAQQLPFDAGCFDIVTCRIAAHHFPDPPRFVSEVARVLASGGAFGLVDNVVPDDEVAASFTNDWERRRDPSHLRCLSLNEWLDLLADAALTIEQAELVSKRMVFSTWADNMNVAPARRTQLLEELTAAPPPATEFLRPELSGESGESEPAFYLTECVVVARS